MTAIEVYRRAEEIQYRQDSRVLNKAESERFEQLWALAEQLAPTKQYNDCHSERHLWFCEEKGLTENSGEHLRSRFPEDTEWFRLELRQQSESKSVLLNNFYLFSCCDTPSDEDALYGFDEMLGWLIQKVSECIEMLKNGSYTAWVEENLSYRFRSGLIERKALYDLYPEVRAQKRCGLSDEETGKFLTYLEEELPEDLYIKDMTANDYYELCKVCYEVMGLEDCADLTAKELFCRHHDWRDKGLRKLDDNDPEAFERWICEDEHPDHKWDIYHSRLVLVTDHTSGKGVRLRLGGAAECFLCDNARVFIELKKRGIPITINNAESIKRTLCENDTIKLVSGLYPDKNFDRTYDIYPICRLPFDERFKALKEKVRWEDIPKSSVLI